MASRVTGACWRRASLVPPNAMKAYVSPSGSACPCGAPRDCGAPLGPARKRVFKFRYSARASWAVPASPCSGMAYPARPWRVSWFRPQRSASSRSDLGDSQFRPLHSPPLEEGAPGSLCRPRVLPPIAGRVAGSSVRFRARGRVCLLCRNCTPRAPAGSERGPARRVTARFGSSWLPPRAPSDNGNCGSSHRRGASAGPPEVGQTRRSAAQAERRGGSSGGARGTRPTRDRVPPRPSR